MGLNAHQYHPSALCSFVLAAVVISEKHSSLSFLNSLWTLRPKNPIHWRWRQPMSILTHASAAGDPLKTRPPSKSLWRILMSHLCSPHQLTSWKSMKMLLSTLSLDKWLLVTLISLLVLSGISLILATLSNKHIGSPSTWVDMLWLLMWFCSHN